MTGTRIWDGYFAEAYTVLRLVVRAPEVIGRGLGRVDPPQRGAQEPALKVLHVPVGIDVVKGHDEIGIDVLGG